MTKLRFSSTFSSWLKHQQWINQLVRLIIHTLFDNGYCICLEYLLFVVASKRLIFTFISHFLPLHFALTKFSLRVLCCAVQCPLNCSPGLLQLNCSPFSPAGQTMDCGFVLEFPLHSPPSLPLVHSSLRFFLSLSVHISQIIRLVSPGRWVVRQ